MRRLINSWMVILGALLMVACTGRGDKQQGVAASATQQKAAKLLTPKSHFQPALPPLELTPEEQRAYLREHFWDDFDFRDTTFLERVDSGQVLQAYAAFVAQVLGPEDGEGMRQLMQRASGSKAMLDYFHRLAEQVLHDPNSPLHSDELYIPVLEAIIESPHHNEWERLAPAYDLEMARQNRIGATANDFRYTLSNGSSGRLHTLKAPYTLLFISNPGCPMCHSIQEAITASPLLMEYINRGDLQVLMLHPDEDLSEWHKHQSEVPEGWIYAYDKGCHIQQKRLYDLKAIPSLYLLDTQKRVLLKDVTDVPLIEWRLSRR